MLQGASMNVNQNDQHEIHIPLHSEVLKSVTPDSPAAQAIINHMKQHSAFTQAQQAPQPGKTPEGYARGAAQSG